MTDEEKRIREEISEMLGAEYAYWSSIEDPKILNHAIGAMVGVSNVLAGVSMGQTAEQYRERIKKRDKPPKGDNT